MWYLCEPTAKRHQSRRAKRIRRADPDKLHALEVTYNRRKRGPDRSLHMQRNTLESESVHANATWFQADQEKRAKTTHKLDGGEEDGECEGKDDAPELPVLRDTEGGGGPVFL